MHLQTLGALRLQDGEFSRPKPLLLLAYLSLEGAKARRYLADLFFMDTADPLNSLSRALPYLRTEAPNTIESDEQKLWTTLSCDAADFIAHADQKQLENALVLYQGPFLESLDLPLGSELEEWVYGTREYLAGRFRNVLMQLAEQEASKGNLTQASNYAETAYTLTGAPELEPDDIKRLYTFLQAGKSTLASKLKQEAADFDIDLSGADLALPEVRETIRHNLPVRATSFVGRDLELVEINRQLANPDIRLLTLHGTGGIGKSRLAVQAAYDQLQQTRGYNPLFLDGIFFVPLDALASADLIPASIAEAVGLELQGQDDTLNQVTRFIGQKHVLLLLDNYEHLMAGATLPSKLLSSCPNLKLLVTSRERLNLEEEWVMTLEGLSVPGQDIRTFEEAQRFEALNLLVQRAKRARLDFTLSQDDLPYALKICQLVEGSPLGIELAAVWVKMMPLAEISKEIESNLSFLTTTSRNVPHRHQSIKAAFEHSWKLLTEKEQETLRKLSVFVGGFRREAAAEVAGATLPILASLVDKSLLRVSENGRYDRHPLLYQYMQEKSNEDVTELSQVRTKFQNYFLRFVLERHGKSMRYKELDVEINNVLHAVNIAVETGEDDYIVTMIRLLVVGEAYFSSRGHTSHSLRLLQIAIEGAKKQHDLESAHYLLVKLGATYRQAMGNLDKALEAYQESLKIARELRNSNREALLFSLIGISLFESGSEKAQTYLDHAYELTKSIQDDLTKSIIFHHLGYVAQSLNEARSFCVQSLGILGKLVKTSANNGEIDSIIFYNLMNLSVVERTSGNFEDALHLCQKALKLSEKYNNQLWAAYSLRNIGETYEIFQQKEKAKKYYQQALSICEKNNMITEIVQLKNLIRDTEFTPTD